MKNKKKFKPNKKSKELSPETSKDIRLDSLVPLLVDMIGRLLAAKGMLRYRKDFIVKVNEIMEDKS